MVILTCPMPQQLRRLAMEVRQMASARQITVVGGGGYGQGNLSGIVVPAATVGALVYGYMWWKGLKFTDLMYVTKKSMAGAVANLNKHLEQVTGALTAAKEHLTQRIQHLDDKIETQKEISKKIQFGISCTSENLTQIDGDLKELQDLVASLDSKVLSLEDKQDKLKSSSRTFSSLTYKEPGLKQLTEIRNKVERAIGDDKPTDAIHNGLDIVEEPTISPQTRPLLRMHSARC